MNVDYSALGTWAAVVVALYLATRDARERHEQTKDKSRVIAGVIRSSIWLINLKVLVLRTVIREERDGFLSEDPSVRFYFTEKVKEIDMSGLERWVGDFHALPMKLRSIIVELMGYLSELKSYSAWLKEFEELSIDERLRFAQDIESNLDRLHALGMRAWRDSDSTFRD